MFEMRLDNLYYLPQKKYSKLNITVNYHSNIASQKQKDFIPLRPIIKKTRFTMSSIKLLLRGDSHPINE